ncbi:ZIP family metal transporter [Methylolobus aquaticus]|uniref:ZIP family metal transporter n=1 Tax=Methylotetracoccus oryzae TaxID=1919059 RepID=UPI0010205585|nr:ZIP family metal transporter [Methylotetracoccus oryzae]RYU61971.1 ZIP family metal transporter [Methylolobus aquaticus]
MLIWIVAFTLLGGVLSVAAASMLLLIPHHRHPDIVPHGVSFALGALLTVALLDLLPDAVEKVGPERVGGLFATVLAGLMGFFLLEKLLIWRHCHASECHVHSEAHFHQPAGTLIVLGDGIHNLVDGVLIGAAFLVDIQLGVVTSLAVAAHEIPQEVGDFAILLQSGYPPARAFMYNLLSSLGAVVGGVLAYLGLESMHDSLPYFLAIAASSFIYVAVADLIPSLHRKTRGIETVQQIVFIAAGVALILTAQSLVHDLERDGGSAHPGPAAAIALPH